MLQISEEPDRQFFRRGDDIRQPRVNRAPRHAVELGRRGILHQHHARLFLDGAQPQRAVGAHAGEDHPDAALLLVFRQGTQEKINGQSQSPGRGGLQQMQHSMQEAHVFVRGNHINPIGPHGHAILHLHHFHAGGALEQLRHDAFARWVQMLHNHAGHAAALGHMGQEMFQRLQPAGGSPNAHDGEIGAHWRWLGGNRLGWVLPGWRFFAARG